MASLIPYIFFNEKETREAMTFYQECFGGELTLNAVEDTPMAAHMAPEHQKSIMHSELRSGDWRLFASDMTGPNFVRGQGTSVAYIGTFDEMKAAFDKICVGGKVTRELIEEYFGTFGDVEDKFGVRWMFQSDMTKPTA